MERWIQMAQEVGFDAVACCDIGTLHSRKEIREMCDESQCQSYRHNWSCPPGCPTLVECQSIMQSYSCAILVQTIGDMEDSFDQEAIIRAGKLHTERVHAICSLLRQHFLHVLGLSDGGCRICEVCAYPDPCLFPNQAVGSMSAYGLFVSKVCQDNGLQYYHGDKTITYTACILFKHELAKDGG